MINTRDLVSILEDCLKLHLFKVQLFKIPLFSTYTSFQKPIFKKLKNKLYQMATYILFLSHTHTNTHPPSDSKI